MSVRLCLAAAAWFCACGVARGHEELIIGRTAANQLKIHFHAKLPVDMPVSVFPGFPGWVAVEQGFESTSLDEPDEDFFQLDQNSDIEFVLVSQDPGIRISNDTGNGYTPVGGTFHFGQPFFDFHPIWNIFDGAPGSEYSIVLFVRDRAAISSDSEEVIVTFTPVRPAAGDADGNGVIDAADITVFINVLLGIDSDPVHVAGADVDASGAADGEDIAPFVTAWMMG